MGTTVTGSVTATPRRTILLVLVVASFACAPWSWIVDGLTPSWVVYPIVLLVGLWRMRRGGAALYFGIAAAAFLLVHLPWAWTAFTGERTGFLPDDLAIHRFEWAITLFAVPLLTALAGFTASREAQASRSIQSPLGAERSLPMSQNKTRRAGVALVVLAGLPLGSERICQGAAAREPN